MSGEFYSGMEPFNKLLRCFRVIAGYFRAVECVLTRASVVRSTARVQWVVGARLRSR